MNQPLEKLIEALREELQQYGEMLARLDQQQEHVMARRSEDLLQSTAEIEMQGQALQRCRHVRGECQATVARAAGLTGDATFAELIPQLPAEVQPLVAALVQDNNESLMRIHERSRQNHMMLCRSMELMSRLLGNLLPTIPTPTYTDKGGVAGGKFPAHAIYQAIG
jgi:hypothetical protein